MNSLISTRRPAGERGHTDISWLDSRHSFSFGDYDDPEHRSFRALRVINEDRVAPGHGFPEHPHRDMEILTYMISGELSHRDSMGHTRTVGAGQAQYMSAGSGVTHSEFNPSPVNESHFLQIWLMPQARAQKPIYAEWSPRRDAGTLVPVATPDGCDGSLAIRQDVRIFAGKLKAGESVRHATSEGRGLWLQVIAGGLDVEGEALDAGDGLALENTTSAEITARTDASFLLFDLA